MKRDNIDNSKTILVITTGFLVVFLLWDHQWALYIALGVAVAGVVSDYLSGKITWVWMKLAWLLSLVIPKILLAAVFYLLLLPLALISRIFRKEAPLTLKNNKESLFVEYNKTIEPSSFEKTW